MKQSEAMKLSSAQHTKYEQAMRTFVDLKKREASGKKVAAFVNALGVGPNEKVPELAKALVEEFHEKDREVQAAGFADGARWMIEELVRQGVIEAD